MIEVEVQLGVIPTVEILFPAAIVGTGGGGGGVGVDVTNSNSTFSVHVNDGDSLSLADITYNVYVDNVLKSSTVLPSMVDNTLNITIN